MSVKFHHGSFLARWFDEYGNELTKAFAIRPEAVRHEAEMRRKTKARRRELKEHPEVSRIRDLCTIWAEPKKYWYEKRVAGDFAAHYGDLRVNQLNEIMVNACVDRWRAEGLAPNTVVNFRHTLSRLLKYFERNGGPRDLREQLRRIPSYEPREIIATVEEERKLFEATAKKPWLRLALAIFFNTGLRRSGALSLAPCHYDRAAKMISLRVKGGYLHHLEIVDDPLWHLPALLDALPQGLPEVPFVELAKGGPVDLSNFYWHFRELKKKAGVSMKLTPHDLRRTFATNLYLNSHSDIRATQKALGHKHLGSTANYIHHVDRQGLREIMNTARMLRFPTTRQAKIAAQKKVG